MANIAVTYTFANSTTADATQVNQNFTDIVNGTSDGTKDFNIGSITVVGATTLNGSMNFGNGTPDDITVSGSLASTIAIKTNNSFNIGSATLGLAGIYYGSAGGFTTKVAGGATSSWTLTLPVTAGSSGYQLTTDGAGVSSWQPVARGPEARQNYAISTSVGTNAMTINLLAGDSTTPSSTNPVSILFRNATAATGDSTLVQVTGALSVIVSSGATLGHTSAVDQYIYLWAMNNAGTIELCVSGSRYDFDEGVVQSSTAISGSATDFNTLYGTSGRSNKAVRLLGRIKSNQATAGTYVANSTGIELFSGREWALNTHWKNTLTFTPNASAYGTISNSNFWWKRMGDSMRVRGSFTMGTPGAATAYIALPTGYSVDSAKFSSTANIQRLGTGAVLDIGAAAVFSNGVGIVCFYDGSDTANIYLTHQVDTISHAYDKVASVSAIYVVGDVVNIDMEVPIKEWRSY